MPSIQELNNGTVMDWDELEMLEEQIKAEFDDNLTGILSKLNQDNNLGRFLTLLHMEHLVQDIPRDFETYKTGKILVIGESKAKKHELEGALKDFGIDKQRLECHLDYEDGKTFDIETVRFNYNVSVIIVGPMPHSGKSKGISGSVISAMENNRTEFPPVVRFGGEGGLKSITKSGFKAIIRELIEDGTVYAS